MESKITIEISPDSATMEYDRGIELQFTVDKGDVLEHFDADEIVAHFDSKDLLDSMDPDVVRDWVYSQ